MLKTNKRAKYGVAVVRVACRDILFKVKLIPLILTIAFPSPTQLRHFPHP
jgi:hypothetical protein